MRVIALHNISAAWDMLRSYAVRRPWQTVVIVVLYLLGGIAESVGVFSLLPLLNALQPQFAGGAPGPHMPAIVADAFAWLGLTPTFGSSVVVLVLAMTFKSLALACADLYIARSTSRLMLETRMEILQAVGQADWDYFVRQPAGQIVNVIGREVETVSAGIVRTMRMLSLVLQALALLCASLLVSWQFTIAGGVIAILIALVLNRFVTVSRVAGVERIRVLNGMLNSLVDGFQGFKALKAMARESALVRLLGLDAERLQRAYMRNEIAGVWLSRGPEALVVLIVGVFIYTAVSFGTIGLSEVAVITALGYRALNRVNQLQLALQKIVGNHEAFRLVASTQARLTELREPAMGTRLPRFEREIEFERVSFSYGDTAVLSGVELTVPARGLTVLLGPSGAGKSTIVDLVLGLRRVTAGRILIDGIPVDELDVRAWRTMVGYVPQDIRLFDRSLFENVALDGAAVGRADVEWALRQAGASDFVNELPAGIDSSIGQSGMALSGGQRQRIALARALVHRPRLLLLDEATSALDPETEQRICATLKDIAAETAILAISHQPKILEIADRAYRIDGGEVWLMAPTIASRETQTG